MLTVLGRRSRSRRFSGRRWRIELKIIFSRKGFDGTAGGCPSPIIDGQPLSMPIPSRMPTPTRFRDLKGVYGSLVSDLTRDKVTADDWCHLDPDINPDSLPRQTGWRGTLGQVSAAQGHLANQGVQPGDLFIFWGLFRPVQHDGRWRYVGKPEHRVWGWLHVAEIIELGVDGSHAVTKRPWLSDHPHTRAGWSAQNVLYVASEEFTLGSRVLPLPGSGTLKTGYRLSEAGATVSTWRTPDWLNPRRGGSGMTYHPPPRWGEDGTVRSAARGQEFVAAPQDEGNASEWLIALLEETLR
jgi:Nucleotide modification associated domain 3